MHDTPPPPTHTHTQGKSIHYKCTEYHIEIQNQIRNQIRNLSSLTQLFYLKKYCSVTTLTLYIIQGT